MPHDQPMMSISVKPLCLIIAFFLFLNKIKCKMICQCLTPIPTYCCKLSVISYTLMGNMPPVMTKFIMSLLSYDQSICRLLEQKVPQRQLLLDPEPIVPRTWPRPAKFFSLWPVPKSTYIPSEQLGCFFKGELMIVTIRSALQSSIFRIWAGYGNKDQSRRQIMKLLGLVGGSDHKVEWGCGPGQTHYGIYGLCQQLVTLSFPSNSLLMGRSIPDSKSGLRVIQDTVLWVGNYSRKHQCFTVVHERTTLVSPTPNDLYYQMRRH